MEHNGSYRPSKAECNATGLYLKEIAFSFIEKFSSTAASTFSSMTSCSSRFRVLYLKLLFSFTNNCFSLKFRSELQLYKGP